MKSKIQHSIIGGLVGTAVMTFVIFMAPMMGMPEMNPAKMLSEMIGFPLIAGWLMHFMIGAIFALGYVLFFDKLVKKINSKLIKGAIFGFAVFVFAQVMMFVMNTMTGGMPPAEGDALLTVIGSIMGHIIYGMVTVYLIEIQPFACPAKNSRRKLAV